MKKIVIVKLSNGCNYLFSAPADITLRNNDNVLVRTCKGETTGVVQHGSFNVNDIGLNAIVGIMKASLPLKPVVGLFQVTRFEHEGEMTDE